MDTNEQNEKIPFFMGKELFVTFCVEQIGQMKAYRYDMFYDIQIILNAIKAVQQREDYLENVTKKEMFIDFLWYFRETGTNISLFLESDKDILEHYQKSNDKIYRVKILVNCDYLFGKHFAEVKRVK